jgi:hypothetical protein
VRKVTTERRGNQKPKSKREKYKIRLVVWIQKLSNSKA